METTIVSKSGTDTILEYIKKTSWRELFFSKFSIGQKILFFLPVPFLYPSIYGVYDLFRNHSWFLFISFGLLMLFSIFIFHKIKATIENSVFEKLYSSESCTTILEYQIENLSKLLGDQNTSENRALWKDYFKNKLNKYSFFIFVFPSTFLFIFLSTIIRPHDKVYLSEFYISLLTLLALEMSFIFIMPAITDYTFNKAVHNEAFKLISEMDKKLTND